MNRKLLAALLALFLLTLACASQTNIQPVATSGGTGGETVTQTPTIQSVFAIGDIITAGEWEFTVYGWHTSNGSQFNHPEEGHVYLFVELSLTNTASSSQNVSSVFQMELKDSLDRVYDIHLGAAIEIASNPFDGEISAGERVRGEVGFMVPSEAGGFVFVFDPDVFGSGKVFVALGDTPTQ